jgi:cysteine desulfuration protein SufE
MDIDEILENFEFLDTQEERYRYIIDLGKGLAGLPEAQKSEANRVHGCMSRVWMVAQPEDGGRLGIGADSDAFIVRGLIAIVLATYAGKTPQDILNTDVLAVFETIGLEQHLSMGRRNGLHAMVKRVKTLAERELGSA